MSSKRNGEEHWLKTEAADLEVQEVELARPGRRLIVIRQRIRQRPEAGGKTLFELEGDRFQALITNLPRSVDVMSRERSVAVAHLDLSLVRETSWPPKRPCLVTGL